MRLLVTCAAMLLATGEAAAESYHCRELAGDPGVALDFAISYASGAYAVTRAQFQIEGDIGYSTTAADPRDLASVTGLDITDNEIRFSLHYTDADYDGDIATVHVVTLSEGAHSLTAGVLHVVAGGLWPVSCEVDHAG